MKTFILWQGNADRRPVYKGVVGGFLWDQFLVAAKRGYGECWLIDANNVQEAKGKVEEAKATTLRGMFVLGFGALEALKKQGGELA